MGTRSSASKRKKLNGDGIKLATLIYGPPKPKETQEELPFGETPERADKKADQ